MFRAIIKQLWNRKRSNISVAIELVCVFCLVWYIVDYLFVFAYNCNIPNTRDIRHTWKVNFGIFPEGTPQYSAEEDEPEALLANFNRLLQILNNYPGVEAVGVCDLGSTPETGYINGERFRSATDTACLAWGQNIALLPTEDFFRVFGYTSGEGQVAVSTSDFDWSGANPAVLSRSMAQALFPDGNAMGREFCPVRNASMIYRVVGVIDDIKRFEFQRVQMAYYLPLRLTADVLSRDGEWSIRNLVIMVRSKASIPDNVFREAFRKEMTDALQIGNFYLKSIVSFSKIKDDTTAEFGIANAIRVRIYLMAFFLLNILLCVMGTFWYRINLRRSEIGLRKALGSTSRNIRNLFFLEGLILLAAAAIMAMVVELQFVKADLIETLGQDRSDLTVYLPDQTALRFLITNAITAAILATVILAAIWLPAKRAASVPPVEALRDE
ncbi:ABC transporter permease [Bacteroidia bacterium]|nr:ABC transporter permease [Bacteroidia bacterium]